MLKYIKTHLKIIIPVVIILLLGISVVTITIINNNLSSTGDEHTETVIVADFSEMTSEEIRDWCAEHQVSCTISTDFSEDIPDGGFVSQDISAGTTINTSQNVNVNFSQGLVPSEGRYLECVNAVEYYVNTQHLSYEAAYHFFNPEYGNDVTQWSVDHARLDWNTVALARAVEFHNDGVTNKDTIRANLIELEFTKDQADFAITHLDNTLANQS